MAAPAAYGNSHCFDQWYSKYTPELYLILFIFLLFMAAPAAYGNSHCFDQWYSKYTPELYLILFIFLLFMAAPAAYGNSQAGVESELQLQPTPQPQRWGTRAAPVIYTPVHGNARSPTHWMRPGIVPASSWILVGFASTVPQWELQPLKFKLTYISHKICNSQRWEEASLWM